MPQIKVSEKTKAELERLKSERFKGLSFSDIILHLIKKFEEKDEKAPEMKWITTKLPGKCARCGREIPIGSRCLWAPGTLVCFNCAMESYADDKVFQKYLLLAELKAAKKGLEKELEQKAKRVRELEAQIRALVGRVDLAKMLIELDKLARKIDIWIDITNSEIRGQLMKILDGILAAMEAIHEVQGIPPPLELKVRRRKVRAHAV